MSCQMCTISIDMLENPPQFPHEPEVSEGPPGYFTLAELPRGEEAERRTVRVYGPCKHCGLPWSDTMPYLGCYSRAAQVAVSRGLGPEGQEVDLA